MKQIKTTVILISIWTILIVLNVIATTSINWTKYRYETGNNGITCSSTESMFIRNDVSDEMACSLMCFMHDKCVTSVYHPETLRCIGCNRKGFKDALPNVAHSIQYTRRDFFVDCKDILAHKKDVDSDVYEITLLDSQVINVLCDMTTGGGGWTVIQKRINGNPRISFNKSFESYQNMFGDIEGEFWLGLKNIQQLTDMPSGIGYYTYTFDNSGGIVQYEGFKLIGGDNTLYIDEEIKGVSTSSILGRFFTHDHDTMGKCAAKSGGGWWYPIAYTSSDSEDCLLNKAYNLNADTRLLQESKIMVRRN